MFTAHTIEPILNIRKFKKIISDKHVSQLNRAICKSELQQTYLEKHYWHKSNKCPHHQMIIIKIKNKLLTTDVVLQNWTLIFKSQKQSVIWYSLKVKTYSNCFCQHFKLSNLIEKSRKSNIYHKNPQISLIRQIAPTERK